MFNRWILPVILLALSAAAYGQSVSQGGSGSAPQSGSGAPTNPCAQALALYINTANGDLYTCPAAGGNWVKWPSAGATPSAGSTGNLQYAGAGNTFAGSPDFNVTSHTLAGGASAIFDMHLAATSGLFLPGGLSTGLLRVTTSTGAIASSELSGDCTTSGSNATVCLSTNGVSFAASATTNTVVASNITSGLLPLAQGGVHASLAATGGAHFVLQQSTVGGNISVARLACADLSDSVASCSSDTTNASNITSGTLAAARLPNPSASTLGGIQSFAAVSNQWIRSISTSGVPAASQPNFTDLAGNIAIGQITALSTNNSILIRDNTGALNQVTAASIGNGNCVGVNALQFTGLTCAGGSGGSGFNGINAQTTTYTLITGDNGKLVTSNGSSLTDLLPAAAPSSTWTAGFQNLNATNVILSPNGLTINGAAANITLLQYQSAYLWTNGTNYFLPNRPLSVGSGITLTESATTEQIGIQSTFVPTITNLLEGNNTTLIDASGTTAYVASPTAGCSNYVLTSGSIVWVVPGTSSLTSATLAVCSQAAKNVKQIDGATNPGTTITAGQPFPAYYDGTVWRDLFSGISSGGGSSAFPLTVSGTITSGGIPYFSSTTQESSSGLLTQYGVVFGGGAGGSPTSSSQGAANMPLIGQGASNPIFSTIAYPTSVSTSNLIYASNSTTLSALATANSGVLVTSGSGVPLISTTLPSGLTIPGYQTTITLTTTGTSGGATLIGATLNIPQYTGGSGGGLGTGPLHRTYTCNQSGGCVQGLAYKLDTSNPSQVIVTNTSDLTLPIAGIAESSVAQGASVEIDIAGESSCLADGTVTAGDVLVNGSNTNGRIKDGLQVKYALVNATNTIIGRALASATVGNLFACEITPNNVGTQLNSASGTLTAVNGGSGLSNPAAHSLLLAEGSSAFSLLTAATAGRVLVDNGSSIDPSFSATPALTSLALGGAAIGSNALAITGSMSISGLISGGTIHQYGASFGTPGGVALTTGSIQYFDMPQACTINGWEISVDAGTATVKYWKIANGTAIPTVANVINTSGVAISTGTHVNSSTVTDFTSTAVTANDIGAVTLTAVSGAGYVQAHLLCQ